MHNMDETDIFVMREFYRLLKEDENTPREIVPERAKKVTDNEKLLSKIIDGTNLTIKTGLEDDFRTRMTTEIKGKEIVITNPGEFVKITDTVYGMIEFYPEKDGDVVIDVSYYRIYRLLKEGFSDKYLETKEEILDDRLKGKNILQNSKAKNRLITAEDLWELKAKEAGIKRYKNPTELWILLQTMDCIIEDLPDEYENEIDINIRNENEVGLIVRSTTVIINDIAGDFETLAGASREIIVRNIRNAEMVELEFVVEI